MRVRDAREKRRRKPIAFRRQRAAASASTPRLRPRRFAPARGFFRAAACELIAPMSVFLSSGLPTRNVWMRSRNFLMTVGINPFLHEQPRAGATNVALIEINSADDAFDGLINRRVLEQNVRRLAAEFERELLGARRRRAAAHLATSRQSRSVPIVRAIAFPTSVLP